MSSLEAYDPGQWENFFILVGTGSAGLTGLVFVAMSINLKAILSDSTHRYRAINMLSGFTSIFVLSALAVMGHSTNRSLGAEWLAISVLAGAINTNGYIHGFSPGSSLYGLGLIRIAGGTACYLGQLVGALLLLFGSRAGIYVAAIALITNFGFLVSGSWLLLVGAVEDAD